ncbi:hypothetical protein F5883DRAFT_522604 [Diaporthe sp. PMI_573]|nr:hypothetical protein F5883DRAFT_522604 [Diaporthaceae sp. PMI_573]
MPTDYRPQTRGEWSSDESPRMVKYSPKHKHGKPVGRREIVEKYVALGFRALERDFNGAVLVSRGAHCQPQTLRDQPKEAARDELLDFEDCDLGAERTLCRLESIL